MEIAAEEIRTKRQRVTIGEGVVEIVIRGLVGKDHLGGRGRHGGRGYCWRESGGRDGLNRRGGLPGGTSGQNDAKQPNSEGFFHGHSFENQWFGEIKAKLRINNKHTLFLNDWRIAFSWGS